MRACVRGFLAAEAGGNNAFSQEMEGFPQEENALAQGKQMKGQTKRPDTQPTDKTTNQQTSKTKQKTWQSSLSIAQTARKRPVLQKR